MITKCINCRYHRTTHKGEERCDKLDIHLHKTPCNGDCILYQIKESNNPQNEEETSERARTEIN